MVSFRYHLVSIVAVFLALALGVLLGTTVINNGIIDDLNRRTDQASTRVHQLQAEVNDLQAQGRISSSYESLSEPLLVKGQLANRKVLILTLDGVDVPEVDGVRTSLENGGASITGILVARPKLGLGAEDDRSTLATLMGMPADAPADQVTSEAGRQLGTRLGQGVGAGGVDLLQQMITDGYVALRSGTGVPADVGGPDQGVVLVSGGVDPPAIDPERFLVPVAESLVGLGRPVVAAETFDTVYPFVAGIRDEGTLDGNLATVDNANTTPGHIAVVLSLRDLFDTPGDGGDYGAKGGATSLFPKT